MWGLIGNQSFMKYIHGIEQGWSISEKRTSVQDVLGSKAFHSKTQTCQSRWGRNCFPSFPWSGGISVPHAGFLCSDSFSDGFHFPSEKLMKPQKKINGMIFLLPHTHQLKDKREGKGNEDILEDRTGRSQIFFLRVSWGSLSHPWHVAPTIPQLRQRE